MTTYTILFNPDFIKASLDPDYRPTPKWDWQNFQTEQDDLESVFDWGQENPSLPRSISVGDVIVRHKNGSKIKHYFLVSATGFKFIKWEGDVPDVWY